MKSKKWYWIIGIIIVVLLLLSLNKKEEVRKDETADLTASLNNKTAVQTKGDRKLAIDVGMDKSNDYGKAFSLAKSAGMQQMGIYINWTDAETSPNKYGHALYPLINSYYPEIGMPIDLTITPINTNQPMMPEDLAGKALNDPVVIARFEKLLDYTFTSLNKVKFTSIIIGSEIDVYAGTDKNRWREYIDFYKTISTYVHQKYPGIPVATELTFSGITSNAKPYLSEINQTSDIVGVSYYPLNGDFTVKKPTIVSTDFATLVNLIPQKPIYFYQFGYPSSSINNSSPEKQRQFIASTFSAWDKYRQNIKMIDFTWLHDTSNSQADQFNTFYGGGGNKQFTAFLASIGLRTYEGADKPAWLELKKQAAARGW